MNEEKNESTTEAKGLSTFKAVAILGSMVLAIIAGSFGLTKFQEWLKPERQEVKVFEGPRNDLTTEDFKTPESAPTVEGEDYVIRGSVRNDTESDNVYSQVSFKALDAKKNFLGVCVDNTFETIKPGQVWEYAAKCDASFAKEIAAVELEGVLNNKAR